jgi:hypothetical protein
MKASARIGKVLVAMVTVAKAWTNKGQRRSQQELLLELLSLIQKLCRFCDDPSIVCLQFSQRMRLKVKRIDDQKGGHYGNVSAFQGNVRALFA